MQQPSKIQLEAIMHGEGPARVVAGPGSGKTFTIIQRIFYLIFNRQISPDSILTITYTKAAAGEMQSRFLADERSQCLTKGLGNVAHFGTIHGICYSILKERRGYHASLTSENKRIRIMEELLKNRGFERMCSAGFAAELLSEISRIKNGISFSGKDFGIPQGSLQLLLNDYTAFMNEWGLCDFDDLILQSLVLLQENAAYREKWQHRIRYLLVDEFQDVNLTQYELIKLLAGKEKNIFVVGDDDQSIYGFRGSVPGIMKRFSQDYPEEKVLFLTDNYRSGERIVHFATEVVKKNKDRIRKEIHAGKAGGKIKGYCCETRMLEEEKLLDDIRSLDKKELFESAVILRTNREAILYEELLTKHKIPVKRKGKKAQNVFEGEAAEDIRSFLRFCKEGEKRSDFLRFMNKPDRYLSSKALLSERVSRKEILSYYRQNKEMCARIETLFAGLLLAEKLSFSQAVRCFRKQLGYENYLLSKYPGDKAGTMKILDELQEGCRLAERGESVDDFFDKMRKKTPCEEEQTEEGITVLTMHAAKGLEFQSVFLPDLNEGVIPDRKVKEEKELEEERRLLYVAITRAREQLFLYYTGERNRKLTRFLCDISLPWNRP